MSQWICAVGYAHCAHDFDLKPAVDNGFNDLIVELWGDADRHVPRARGQRPSPDDVSIIIVDAIAEVSE